MKKEQSPLIIRPYQLMCIVCKSGSKNNIKNERLKKILKLIKENPERPLTLRCNVNNIYSYQNPGKDEDTPEGELFNKKRDLDILQKLGLVPGSTRPARDLLDRLFKNISTTKGICGYGMVTSDTWRGCPYAESGNYEKAHAKGLTAIIPPRSEVEKKQFKKQSVRAMYRAKRLSLRPHHLMCMTCFYGGTMEHFAPIKEDNLFEAIDIIQKNPDIPVTLVQGPCMICPPCGAYNPEKNLCVGTISMGLRDEKKDLAVLQKLDLKYGDTLPARKIFQLLFERIKSTSEICGYGDMIERSPEWSICGNDGPNGSETYIKGRSAGLGFLKHEK